ncbi:alanine racemase [Hutsoniella sourekii]|uniref:alanine racemase n=1 Tax=Hutsoniella sourekii TaxID=87650 RepID=UPI000480ECDE|nr:alanine racemase [Hutsoniella sourekii]
MSIITPYPQLLIDLAKVRANARALKALNQEQNIETTIITKGVAGDRQVSQAILEAGISSIGSSRLSHLETVKSLDSTIYTLMIRIPMLSELDQMLEVANASLQSELVTIQATDQLAQDKSQVHDIILMVELGDLREGFLHPQELVEVAKRVEFDCPGLYLKGIGSNLGCYGSIRPTREKMEDLSELARQVEAAIGRSLDWVSGGASTNMPLVLNQSMPAKINHLRLGYVTYSRGLEADFDFSLEQTQDAAFQIRAEIIEVKDKPSHPIGEIVADAFGRRPVYQDIGTRRRALLALGRQDVGELEKLSPLDSHITIVGGSSDHLIVDLSNCQNTYQVGDQLDFVLDYENILYAMNAQDLNKQYSDDSNSSL